MAARTALNDLLGSRLPNPTREQDRVNQGFREAVRHSRFGWRDPAGPIRRTGLHIAIGLMVAWNDYERRLVIALDRVVEDGQTEGDVIEVFNADEISSIDQLRNTFPAGMRA